MTSSVMHINAMTSPMTSTITHVNASAARDVLQMKLQLTDLLRENDRLDRHIKELKLDCAELEDDLGNTRMEACEAACVAQEAQEAAERLRTDIDRNASWNSELRHEMLRAREEIVNAKASLHRLGLDSTTRSVSPQEVEQSGDDTAASASNRSFSLLSQGKSSSMHNVLQFVGLAGEESIDERPSKPASPTAQRQLEKMPSRRLSLAPAPNGKKPSRRASMSDLLGASRRRLSLCDVGKSNSQPSDSKPPVLEKSPWKQLVDSASNILHGEEESNYLKELHLREEKRMMRQSSARNLPDGVARNVHRQRSYRNGREDSC